MFISDNYLKFALEDWGYQIAKVDSCKLTVPVRQKLVARGTVKLLHGVFRDESLGVQLEKYVLGTLGHVGGGGPTKVVEADVEPLVDVAVDGVVLVTDLPGSQALRQGLGLRRSSMLVRAANVQGVVASKAAVASKHVGTKTKGINLSLASQ